MRDPVCKLLMLCVITLALPACKGDGGGVEATTPAPQEPATGADERAVVVDRPVTPRSAELAIMDGYEPLLKDSPGDVAADTDPAFDLTSAFAVDIGDALLLRVVGRQPMTVDHTTDIRLWVEQGERLLTIEAKPDHPDRICELTPIGRTEGDEVKDCLELGEALDLRIPKDRLPRWLQTGKAYFISGVSTCCADEARETPYDEIDGAQQVWVFTDEVESGEPEGGDAAEEPSAEPAVP